MKNKGNEPVQGKENQMEVRARRNRCTNITRWKGKENKKEKQGK